MINLDVISYFLAKNQFDFTVYNYDKDLFVNTMRHFDAPKDWEHTLILLQEDEQSGLFTKQLTTTQANNILVYITNTSNFHYPDVDHSGCPLVVVHTTEITKLLNLLGQTTELFHRFEMQLQLFHLTSKNYQELIDITDPLLEVPLSLLDKDFFYIAYSKEKSAEMGYVEERVENGRLSIKVASQLMSTPGFETLEQHREVFDFEDDYHFMAKNIHIEDRYVARLVLMHSANQQVNAYHAYILNRLADCITEKYSKEGTFYVNHEPTHLLHVFIRDALDGQVVTEAMWTQALREKGWTMKDGYSFMVFNTTYRREKKLHSEYLCPQIENMWHYTAAIEWQEKTVVLINQKHLDKNFEQSLAYFVRDNLLTAGISRQFYGFSKLKDFYKQATIAMEIGIQESPHLWYYFFEQYAISYLKKQCTMDLPAEGICHPALLMLQEYDAKNGSNYLDSLRLLIQTQYNMSAAANLAYVHRTTFIKRMERIVEITGIDLTDWDTRMYLMLSYLLIENK